MGSTSKTALAVLSLALLTGGAWWLQQRTMAPDPVAEPSAVVASVNGVVITRDDFIREMRQRGGKLPGQYQTVEQRRELLDLMLEKRALVQSARVAGYEQDPEIVARYEDMLARKFRQDRLKKRLDAVTVSDREVEEFYQQHKQDYARPARRQVAMVFIAVPPKASEETWTKAAETLNQVHEAAKELPAETLHFGAVAGKYSDDRATRYRGGVMGWLVEHPGRAYKWDEKVMETAFALQRDGDISEPVKTDQGYYLLRLVKNQEIQIQPLEKLRDGLHNRLLSERRREEQQRLMDEVHQGLDIVVNEPILAAIEPISKEQKTAAVRRPPAMP